MDGIEVLAKYGSTGIAIALVALLWLIVRKVLKLVGNHIKHNTEALTKLSDSISQLSDTMEDD